MKNPYISPQTTLQTIRCLQIVAASWQVDPYTPIEDTEGE